MDEQKIDPRRTNPRPSDDAQGNLLQDDATEAPSVPLVGGHDRAGNPGTAGAGPMQGAASGGGSGGGGGLGGLSGRIESRGTGGGGDDPTGFIGSSDNDLGGGVGREGGPDDVLSGETRSGYGGTGAADPAGNWTGQDNDDLATGDDGLTGGGTGEAEVERTTGDERDHPQPIGGMRSDADVSGAGGPSGSRGGDEFGTRGGDSLMTGSGEDHAGRQHAKVDDANTPYSGTLPGDDEIDDAENDRRSTPATG